MKTKVEEKQKAIELRTNGLSYKEIKDILKVSKGSLSLWLSDLPRPEKFTNEYRAEKKKERLDGLKEEAKIRTTVRLQNRKQAKTDAEYPYDDYWLYGPVLHKNEGRYYAHLKLKSNLEVCKIRLYSKYLMEVHLGRFIPTDTHVDHIDDNKNNDKTDNFQLLTPAENRLKQKEKNLRELHTEIACSNLKCNKIFKKRFKAIKETNFCSKACVSMYLSYTRKGQAIGHKGLKYIDSKKEILELHEKGLSNYKIQDILGIPQATICRMIKKYTSKDSLLD
jgi:transposase/transposase-like protein